MASIVHLKSANVIFEPSSQTASGLMFIVSVIAPVRMHRRWFQCHQRSSRGCGCGLWGRCRGASRLNCRVIAGAVAIATARCGDESKADGYCSVTGAAFRDPHVGVPPM